MENVQFIFITKSDVNDVKQNNVVIKLSYNDSNDENLHQIQPSPFLLGRTLTATYWTHTQLGYHAGIYFYTYIQTQKYAYIIKAVIDTNAHQSHDDYLSMIIGIAPRIAYA